MNEITVTTPNVIYAPSKVACDFSNLDNEISEIKKRYDNWLPSETEIKDAEKIAKDLNSAAKKLNDEKIRIKKEINKESKSFEDEVMSRVNELKSVRQNIIDHLDVYEQERIDKKSEIITDFIEDYCSKINFDVPAQHVMENHMFNKTCTDKKWQQEVKQKIDDHYLNYKLLAQMHVDDVELLQSIYKQKWDRMIALDEYNAQQEAKKIAEEIKKQKEDVLEEKVKETVISNNASYMITVSGPEILIDNSIERMRSLGLVVEVL